jgi:hypothetical protein
MGRQYAEKTHLATTRGSNGLIPPATSFLLGSFLKIPPFDDLLAGCAQVRVLEREKHEA